MRVLFISKDLLAGDVARLIKEEGHEVKLYIKDKARRENLEGMVDKTNDWKKELKWVGKEGLIVFDDVGFGADQDKLRKQGYAVFGGSERADLLETDRKYGQQIFAEYGMDTVENEKFQNIPEAIAYIKKNKGPWVIKQNMYASKSTNYVGHMEDGRDVISVLQSYHSQRKAVEICPIFLQKRVEGIEIGVARYFNGKDWVGPIEFNVEYKRMFDGDLGPTTSEMGTLAWYSDDESIKLYEETLAKIEPYLKEIEFKGDIDINCIVNEHGAFPLEATPRLGSPIIHLHSELNTSPWGEFMNAIARGEAYDHKWNKGYGIVVLLAVPPFPYASEIKGLYSKGIDAYFDGLTKKDMKSIHFEEISKRHDGTYYVSDNRGYVLYVTTSGTTIGEARSKAYSIASKIIVPKAFYRHDIGLSFSVRNGRKLKEWGWLT